ncbi:MAG: hypothetical protein LIP00_06265 [Parabacteroides sp.]|nr:hypothetical protein [Parabacteroides sp.]
MCKNSTCKALVFFCWLTVTLFAAEKALAQRPLIDIRIDSAAILVGEQTEIHLTVTTDKGKEVLIPIPNDTLMAGVEVLKISEPDSSLIENNKLVIKQDVLITSFDSALYLLPPFKVIDRNDTVYSGQVALKVSTFPVDTDHPEEFNDIKTIWKAPFVFSDYYPVIFGTLIALLVICIIGYIVQRLKQKKSLIPFRKEEPKLLPHEQAIKELDEIKQQKLWQQGRNKEYYTQLTDVLRNYIVERFGINAMEMTSAEILEMLRNEEEANPVYANLRDMLELSDFVKFAKWHPLPDENERSLQNAYLFVNRTIPVIQEVVTEEVPEAPDDQNTEAK